MYAPVDRKGTKASNSRAWADSSTSIPRESFLQLQSTTWYIKLRLCSMQASKGVHEYKVHGGKTEAILRNQG
jgi:hypothetical protein